MLLDQILEHVPSSIFWKALDGSFLGCNQKFLSMAGMSSLAEIVGKEDHQLPWADRKEQYRKDDLEVIERKITLMRIEKITLPGRVITAKTTKTPLIEAGKIIGVLGIFEDITDLTEALAREEIANAKNRFISILSHEVRSPLSSVISAADLLKSTDNSGIPMLGEMVNIIDTQARKVLNILKTAAQYMELDDSNIEMHHTSVNMYSFLSCLAESYEHQVKAGTKFLFQMEPKNIDYVEFDVMHVIEILEILLENAIKHTVSGTISLKVSISTPNTLCFSLEDTGIGISADQLKNIFKTFLNPAELNAESPYLKTGLKLPLARRVAELIGGKLDVQSKLGVGTVVTLSIPYFAISFSNQSHKMFVGQKKNQFSHPQRLTHQLAFKILLVEDDEVNAQLETKILSSFGCQVTWAKSAIEAIDIVKENLFDLIFVDITLPDITGVAFVKTITPLLSDKTEIVAVTSHFSEADREYFMKEGIMTILPKPFTENAFKDFFYSYLLSLENFSD